MPKNQDATRLRNAEPDATAPDVALVIEDFVPPAPVKLGPPFCIVTDCDLLSPQQGVPGSLASVQCGKCQTGFVLDLLRPQVSRCPECKQAYTHALVVCPVDDTASVDEFMEAIAVANNYEPGADLDREDNPDDDDSDSVDGTDDDDDDDDDDTDGDDVDA